jgi:preprotein translocase subunit SecA
MGLLRGLIDTEYKELKRFRKIADKIMALDDQYSKMSDDELKHMTKDLKEMLENGKTVNDEEIIVPAFATIREAAWRVIGEKPYYVQLLGGLAIHFGNIAELKTGEGKTLTTILPAYLNALTGKGVHVVTVNEYLTQRNAEWMGPIYEFLGLTVGVNLRELSPEEKRAAYNADITYSTNNEVGFDYLRDNMVVRPEDRVQRELNYVILDEIDSMLIDEARTPLIISGGKVNSANLYKEADKAVKSLKEDEDYTVDLKSKSVMLTEEGSKKVEKFFSIDNLYDLNNTALVHHINQALKANYGMALDVDYVVDGEGKVVIVDQFTGRLMEGRQFSDGLHQAIEAKEGVQINEETRTMATITFQNYFRMYAKISGMTGTAKTEEEEFREIYNMYVIEIPTNKPCIRKDMADIMYATESAKYKAIVEFIRQVHETGQPILVGTISVENNERLSKMLDKIKIKHEVLNAKNHAREAEIIEKAGQKGAVTIATNMAGRGTDIKLGEGVAELGGLCVIGTERHESRRIDNQLRGRAGRQGDPGYSQFFISFEDELLRRFVPESIKTAVQNLGLDDMEQIRSKMFSRSVESAQKKVEGNNYDMRKGLLDYDNIVSQQRLVIYKRRNEVLDSENIHEVVLDFMRDYIDDMIHSHLAPEGYLTDADIEGIIDTVNPSIKHDKFKVEDLSGKSEDEIYNLVSNKVIEEYEHKISIVPENIVQDFERHISLRVIDEAWIKHITDMDNLREGIGLRGYGQRNPLQAYAKEGYEIFEEMQDGIEQSISNFLLRMEIKQNFAARPVEGNYADGKEKVKTHDKSKKKVGRNDLCPCGSGKKYKQCCGKSEK